jgi:cytoskeleton protein RodZ
MTDIGATLREARMRARIDVSEIEAKTKIRARYLRALENEEWDLLPGPTFVRSFLRTYAQALDLDAKALVEEYRVRYEQPADLDHQPVVSASRRARPRSAVRKPPQGYVLAVGAIGVVIVLLLIGLLAGGKGSPSTKAAGTGKAGAGTGRSLSSSAPGHTRRSGSVQPRRVSLSLRPSAPVYVCLIGDGGRRLIPGLILQPPYTQVTYRASRFQITLGNSSITMYVNGRPRTVPASSQAIGYSVTSAGRHTLAAGRLPTCK